MRFKNFFNNFFSYKPENNYEFNLSKNTQTEQFQLSKENNAKEKVKIFPSLQVNIEYMKTIYNIMINSDIILREFTINARGKQYNAFIVYIDGMVDSKIMNDFILKPLMLRNKNNLYDGSHSKVISEAISNNITVRKVKKFNLPNYLMGCLMPQNSVKEISDFTKATSSINSRKLCFVY